MNINLTKKPMKPMTTKPKAVLEQILLNSTQEHKPGLSSGDMPTQHKSKITFAELDSAELQFQKEKLYLSYRVLYTA